MNDKRRAEELSIEELEQLLYLKKHAQRRQRLERMRAEGRLVEINDLVATDKEQLIKQGSVDNETNATQENSEEPLDQDARFYDLFKEIPEEEPDERPRIQWRWVFNRLLLFIEVGAVVGLIVLAMMVWSTTQELNREIAEVQEAQSASLEFPTPTPTPVIGVVVLPSGHKPPINGQPPQPGEAGNIPAHLLPIIDAYDPPPIPTPGPEQARRIQVPAINIDKPIVQGDGWDQLKKGVGQHIGSGVPGREGNLVLSAHNDIYGEIFRHLDKLSLGDSIIISTERRSYTYIVREIDVVEPTDVWAMAPTEHASATLISCYPYLVNNKRIVVFADLASANYISRPSS
jgi:sortase A